MPVSSQSEDLTRTDWRMEERNGWCIVENEDVTKSWVSTLAGFASISTYTQGFFWREVGRVDPDSSKVCFCSEG